MHEVLVIGGGCAGTFAALRLARAGVDVACVSSGPPSVLMSGGVCFVGAGFPEDEEFARLWSHVFERVVLGPDTFVGYEGGLVEAARGPVGAARVSAIGDGDVMVMDVPGLPGPDATLLSFVLGERLDRKVRGTRLKLQYSADDFALTPVLWARRFDDRTRRAELISHLLRRLLDEPADTVLVPPIMGITFHRELLDILDESAPGTVMELTGGPGWPPGLRLAGCIQEALARSDVTLITGRALEGLRAPAGRELRTVVTDSGDEIQAERFLLATGHVVGGGLRLSATLEESALGLPVHVDGQPVRAVPPPGRADPALLFGADPGDDQPILRAGVQVDDGMRPVDTSGRVVYTNLFACGDVVARRRDRGASVLDPGTSAQDGFLAAGKLI